LKKQRFPPVRITEQYMVGICDTRLQGKYGMQSIATQNIYQQNKWHEIVAILIALRKKRKISQDKLADIINCDRSLIHKWEQHKRMPSVLYLMMWINALEATLEIKEQ